MSNFAVLQLPKVLAVNLGRSSNLVQAFSVMYPFVRTSMTGEYAENEKVFGRWQPRMLEPHEAAEAFLALLARPIAETDQAMFELMVDAAEPGIAVTWKQVRLDVSEHDLGWSADAPLRY